jgi:hypothetical protein
MTPQQVQDFLWQYEASVHYRHTPDGARLVTVKVSVAHPATARTLRDAVVALSYNVEGLRRPVREPG